MKGRLEAWPVNKMPGANGIIGDESGSPALLQPRYILRRRIIAMIGSAGWGSTRAPARLGSAHLGGGQCAEPPRLVFISARKPEDRSRSDRLPGLASPQRMQTSLPRARRRSGEAEAKSRPSALGIVRP